MILLVFIYVYRIDMNIERLVPCSNKHNLHLRIIPSSNNKSTQQSTFKSKQKYDKLPLFFKLFFIDAINWKFVYIFLLALLQ